MADKKKSLSDKFKKTVGVFPTTTVNKNSPLKSDAADFFKRRSILSGNSKLAKVSDTIKNIGKRSIVGRVINAATTAGLGAAAGYEYAKKKFKKDEKVDKKATGGMAEYIKDLL